MNIELQQQVFAWPPYQVTLYVPDQQALQQKWQQRAGENTFPYWAKIWPAAIALCRFIQQYPAFVQNKNVIEIAAGLALPSLYAAHMARQVTCSDIATEAQWVVNESIKANKLSNIRSVTMDWNHLPPTQADDVLLLSDVNYDETIFIELLQVLKKCLQNKTTILLSTPQRLMAKPFVEKLLPYCIQREEITIELRGDTIFTTVFVLVNIPS